MGMVKNIFNQNCPVWGLPPIAWRPTGCFSLVPPPPKKKEEKKEEEEEKVPSTKKLI